jgi:hypothetical protein
VKAQELYHSLVMNALTGELSVNTATMFQTELALLPSEYYDTVKS